MLCWFLTYINMNHHRYTYVPYLLNLSPTSHPSKSSQSNKFELTASYSKSHPLLHPLCPQVCSLCLHLYSVQSVTQSCPTLCNPMDCSTPGFPVHHQLPELTQTHVHRSWWCHPTISSSVVPFSCLQSFPASGSFQMSQFCTSNGHSTGVSSSTSVLPMNTQDWFPLGWTVWISLQSKALSRVFSNTTVQKLQFFGAQLSL